MLTVGPMLILLVLVGLLIFGVELFRRLQTDELREEIRLLKENST